MKIKSLLFILISSMSTGIGFSFAETPVAGVVSNSVIDSGIVAPFSVEVQHAIPVNEGEIRAGLLYDAVNGKVVWQKNMATAYPMASLTKMMVAFLAIEDIKAGLFTWEDRVKWTRQVVVGRGRHRKRVKQEVNYSLRDVFKAAMIASNNECSEQLARHIGCGNLQETIDRMNARAKSLGMMNTYYGNPTGLPAPHSMFDNTSSPSDLLVLTLEMLKYNEILDIAGMGYANIENGRSSSVIRNHNRLTIDYSGEVDGLKTGYTKRAGFCLVATTAKCDHRLVSIVLGCRGPQIRNEVVKNMINDYYTTIALDPLGPSGPSLSDPNEPSFAQKVSPNGKYVTINETVKKYHKIKRGETLASVAKKYGCTSSQIKGWNKTKFSRSSKLIAGNSLAVYVSQPRSIYIEKPLNGSESEDDQLLLTEAEKTDLDRSVEEQEKQKPTIVKASEKSTTSNYLYHTVAPGDTLFNIAKRYEGITVEDLKSLNKIQDGRQLKPGTKIKVKVKA